MIVARAAGYLLGCEREAFAAGLDHLAHLAHALGALGLAPVRGEDVAGTLGARFNGLGHVASTKAVAVADVHEANTHAGD